MHAPDRYALAIAMLDGDRDARRVLADMLEEQGERGLAQWARQGRRDKRRTVDFAIALLSCRPAMGFAGELVKEANVARLGAAGDRLVRALQQWASGRMNDADAIESCQREAAACRKELENPYVRFDERRERAFAQLGVTLLVDAFQKAIDAERLAAECDSRRAAGRQREALLHVRQLARQTTGFAPRMAPDGSMRYLSTVAWQSDRLKQLLQALLASEHDLWPK